MGTDWQPFFDRYVYGTEVRSYRIDDYSWRKETVGSTVVARRAGR